MLLQIGWPAIKKEAFSIPTVKVERRDATTMTTSTRQLQQQRQQQQHHHQQIHKYRQKTKWQTKIFQIIILVKPVSAKNKKGRIQSTKILQKTQNSKNAKQEYKIHKKKKTTGKQEQQKYKTFKRLETVKKSKF